MVSSCMSLEAYLNRIREKSESFDTTECRQTTERLYLQITYQLAATANSETDDIEEQIRIGMCRNVIDEINLHVKEFKTKAYKHGNLSDEELEVEELEDAENV